MSILIADGPESSGRLERRKARTRASILEAANALFHMKGFEATSIAQIAEAADTGVGTVYGYFASKDEVLRVVLRKHSDLALQRYAEAVDANTPAIERACLALSVFSLFLRENRAILLAAVQSSARLAHDEGEAPMQWLARAYGHLLEQGMASGELTNLPPDTTARALISMYMTAILGVGVWSGRAADAPVEQDLEAIARAMLTRC